MVIILSKEFQIQGCVEVPMNLSEDEFSINLLVLLNPTTGHLVEVSMKSLMDFISMLMAQKENMCLRICPKTCMIT